MLFSESDIFNVSGSTILPEKVFHPTMDEMDHLEDYVEKIEKTELDSGAVKIIPPSDYRPKVGFQENSTLLDNQILIPKIQHSQKVAKGIYKLCNNPLRDIDKKDTNRKKVKVNLDY